MSEKLCTVPLRRELLSGRNAGRKNSTPEDSGLCSMPSAARSLAPMRRVAVYIISGPTDSVCAIRSSTPKACVLPPALSRPDARLPLARASNAPVCTGPFKAPMPSSLSAAQNSAVVFKTSGSADQNAGLHNPSLSWRAPNEIQDARVVRSKKVNRGIRLRGQRLVDGSRLQNTGVDQGLLQRKLA